jgi:hypothetical protein
MAKEGSTRLDVPADMLALAEKSVEQAKQAFDIFISVAQHAISTAETQAVIAHAGAKQVGELPMGFAERNITSSFKFVQKLLQAKEPKDVLALHAEYVNTQIAALTEQAKELGKTRGESDWARYPALRLLAVFCPRPRRHIAISSVLCNAIFYIALHQKWEYKS